MLSLHALWAAHGNLFGRRSPYRELADSTCSNLLTLFEEIKQGISPLPPSQLNFGLVIGYTSNNHRRPVWDAMDEVFKSHSKAAALQSFQERVKWFQDILHLCIRYENLQELIKKWTVEAKNIGLNLTVDTHAGDMFLTCKREETGINAREIALELVPEMLEAVNSLVNK